MLADIVPGVSSALPPAACAENADGCIAAPAEGTPISRHSTHAVRSPGPQADPGTKVESVDDAEGLKDHTTDSCMKGIDSVDSVLSTDGPSSDLAAGNVFSNNPFIKMLKEYKPPKGVLLDGRKSTNRSNVHFSAKLREPVPGTLRPERKEPPVKVKSAPNNPWLFPAHDAKKRSIRGRAAAKLAVEKASELEDDVYFFQIDCSKAKLGSAAAGEVECHGDVKGDEGPLRLGAMRFIIDTGCGNNLVAEKFLKNADAMGRIQRLDEPLTLNTAGGPSKALGSVSAVLDNLSENGRDIDLDFVVMKQTPGVISVGELCLDRGFSFHWPSGKSPYLILPGGRRLNLTVDGKIPYLYAKHVQAMGQVDVAAASVLRRWGCATCSANTYLDDPSVVGGPPRHTIKSRTTHELHTQDVIAEHDYVDGRPVQSAVEDPALDGRDTLTYFYYEPGEAKAAGWVQSGRSVASTPPPPTPATGYAAYSPRGRSRDACPGGGWNC